MNSYCILALSVNKDKLESKMLKSLRNNYTDEELHNYNFEVICQGFNSAELATEYSFCHFTDCNRIKGTISKIRRELLEASNLMRKYDYLILIDDDFSFGSSALKQYDYYINEMSRIPSLGMIACHHRLKPSSRELISPVEIPYPQDLSVISMRTGLIIRCSAITPAEMFDDRIQYHEEFYIALMYYIRGYDIGKGWVDVNHQSRAGGLGNHLQKLYNTATCNDSMSSKRIAHEEGLFDVNDDDIYYGAQNVGAVSKRAINLHNITNPIRR